MLKVENLEKKFGDFYAIDGLNLDIEEASIYGLVGRNGAGKTTAMKIISGILPFDKGKVKIAGLDIKKELKKAQMNIAYIPDGFGFYENLSVYEYMDFFANIYGLVGLVARKRIFYLLEIVGLSSKADFLVDKLSKGMKQRLALARALIHEPKFLIMDEPSSGLDPISRYSFKELIRQLCESGKTILISSHILGELSEICTHLGIIDRGKLLINGKIEDIMDNISKSNPIEINILDGGSIALEVFKKNPHISSISIQDNIFKLGFNGSKQDEAELLNSLINNNIKISSFIRELGNLESFFIKMTDQDKEKVILKNEY